MTVPIPGSGFIEPRAPLTPKADWKDRRVSWIQRLGQRIATPKVRIARRVGRKANPACRIDAIQGDITDPIVARRFTDCDYLFLAADGMQSRLVFNAMVHQYLIPGVQMGAKIVPDRATGEILDVFSVARPVTPDRGCLWCNQLISPAGLQREAATAGERRAQRYVDEPDVVAPSVITLNATAASQATNDFLFAFTGLTRRQSSLAYVRFKPRDRAIALDEPRAEESCLECGLRMDSRRAVGDGRSLPIRS